MSLGFQHSPVSAEAWSVQQGEGTDSPRGAPARLTPSPVSDYIGDGEGRTQDTLAGKAARQFKEKKKIMLEGNELHCTVTAAVPQLPNMYE